MALARLFPLVSLTLAVAFAAIAAPAAAAAPMASQPLREPERSDPLLQITEVAVDTRNVSGVDGYEFVEIVNASDAPQDFADFRLRYVYPLVDFTTVAHSVWPVDGVSPVLEPGQTLVLWVVTDQTEHLSVADFNAAHGVHLVEGRDLVRVRGAGLANGSMRGVEIAAASGISISRAYYNVDGADDAVKDRAAHYGRVALAHEVQPRLRTSTTTPGRLDAEQTIGSTVADPGAGDEPSLLTDSRTTFTPGRALTLDAWASDDGLVRSVTLEISTDLDPEPVLHPLVVDEVGLYVHELAAADTMGRSSITYRFLASDGYSEVATKPVTLARAAEPAAVRLRAVDGWEALNRQAVETSTVGSPAVRDLAANADVVAGKVHLVATGADAASLEVDGTPLAVTPELEDEPYFAFDATLTDAYFRNGVLLGDEVLTVFDEGYYSDRRTVQTAVPLEAVNPGEPFTLRVMSGTKARTAVDDDEANDDFEIANLRLVLPDGTTLRPAEHPDGTAALQVGDGERSADWIDATFTVPDEHFSASAAVWDSTAVADGEHKVTASVGQDTASAVLVVDNTAPVLVPTVAPGTVVRGEVVLDVVARDGGAGLGSVSATLDGRAVVLPVEISSLTGEPGEHAVVVTASDERGNAATLEIPFSIPDEAPRITLAAGPEATVTDAAGDALDVTFARARALSLGTDVRVSAGSVERADAMADARSGAELAGVDLGALAAVDGEALDAGTAEGLPYVVVEVPALEQAGSDLRVRWNGSAEPGARVVLSIADADTGDWTAVDSAVASDTGELELEAVVPAAAVPAHGTVTALIQHGAGYAGADLSPRQDLAEPHHPEDTPRGDYDFTLAWESDTQYYNAREDIHDRQVAIHDYLLAQRANLNLQYVIHTGDIVDWSTGDTQWKRADPVYAAFDDAGLPYGVLAGNHDVDQQTNDYTNFSRWFGAERFQDNAWFGGDHLDNRGHYDLITAGGIEFLFLYMGWGAGDEQIRWMNAVLAAYPERTAFVNLHEYMLTTGGLGITPQRIHDEVVATNPNVRFVLSGHYHDAFTRTDAFDDDGDGSDDRTVTSMLFDYQDLPHGGEGYLRLLHFDNTSRTVTVRTYSDYLRDYNAVHPSLAPEHQEFTIPYAQAGLDPAPARLSTDALRVDLLGQDAFAHFADVPAGTTVSAGAGVADADEWYVKVADPHGAVVMSDVQTG